MPGYETLEKTITVNDNNVYYNFQLQKIQDVPLMIESNPPGVTCTNPGGLICTYFTQIKRSAEHTVGR